MHDISERNKKPEQSIEEKNLIEVIETEDSRLYKQSFNRGDNRNHLTVFICSFGADIRLGRR